MGRDNITILEAITPSTVGGAEVFVAGTSKLLAELGAHVEVFCPRGRRFVEYASERGISPITWPTHGKADLLTVIRFVRLIKRTHADVIHTHLSTASLLGALAAKLAGIPSVAHVHGLNSATCFRRSTALIAVSQAVKDHICAQGIAPEKVRVIHNGVDLSSFQVTDQHEARRKLGYDAVTPLFGIFGRLSTEKGQVVAIEAMSAVVRQYPDAKLILVGTGKNLEALQETASAFGVADNVQFAGFAQDVRPIMSACDAVIVPSLKEGLGLTAIEAMALGRPVIVSAVGGLVESVVDEQTGFIVPPNDPHAIADSLCRLIEDKALGERMGVCGRARVEEHFDMKRQVGKLLDAMREIVEGYRR